MTAKEKAALRKAIATFSGDGNSYAVAMDMLHDLHGPITEKQYEDMNRITARLSSDWEERP